MRKLGFSLGLLVITLVGHVHAQTVQTEVGAFGKSSYFYEEHHPTKFDWDTMTFCLGKNSHADSGNYKADEQKSSQNRGKLGVYTGIDGPNTRLSQLLNQRLEWESVFDDKDYVFHVQFKKEMGKGAYIHERNVCNTKAWYYKVDEAKSRIKTSLKLVVPQGIYVVRLRPRVNRIGAAFTAGRVARMDDPKAEPQLEGSLEIPAAQSNYFFVQPGDEIQLKLDFNDDNRDVDLLADVEVTFVGYNRCEKGVADMKAMAGVRSESLLTKNVVTSSLQAVTERLQSGDFEALDKAILFLGCLTSAEVVRTVQYENNPTQIKDTLDAISDFNSRGDFKKAPFLTKALSNVEAMARYAVARATIQGLRPLCERYPFLQDQKKVGDMTGYLFFRNRLDRIGRLLGLLSSGGSVADYYKGLLAALKPAHGKTYADLIRNRDEWVRFARDYQAGNKVSPIEQAMSELNRLPPIQPTRALVTLAQGLKNLRQVSRAINIDVLNLIDGLQSASPGRTLNLQQMTANVNIFNVEFARTQAAFKDIYQMVDGESAQLFSENLASMNESHVDAVKQYFAKTYGGFLLKFVNSQNDQSAISAKELNECIHNPVSLTN